LFWPLLWRERLVCVQPREGSGWLLWWRKMALGRGALWMAKGWLALFL
jgi:hypothetical protein